MNAEELRNFEVELEGERLVLKTTGPMPDKAVRYLQKHLDRLNEFKTVGWWHGGRSISFFDPPLPHPAGKRGLVHRLERVFLKKRMPAAADLAISYACQAKCEHCSCAPMRRPGRKPLDTPTWKRLIEETVNIGTTNVIFVGGEPLLHPDLYELIAHVDEDKATTLMFTNGEYLTPENCRRLKDAGLYSMFVSLDSPMPEIHNQRRGRAGLFDKVVVNIGHAKEAGLLVGLSIYLTREKHQAGELDAFMDIARQLEVNEVICFDAIPTGRLFGQMEVLLTQEDREQIRHKNMEYYRNPDFPSLTTQAYVNSPLSMGCFAAFNQFYMTAYGDMCPCDFTPISFGNAVTDGVATIWERMTRHAIWGQHHMDCRMQSPEFRSQTVDRIPAGAPMPYPIELLDQTQAPLEASEPQPVQCRTCRAHRIP